MADLVAGSDLVNLRGPVTTGGDIAAVSAEADAAHDRLMRQVMYKLDVELTARARIENSVPVLTLTLEVRRELVRIVVGELIADLFDLLMRVLEVVATVGRVCAWVAAAGTLLQLLLLRLRRLLLLLLWAWRRSRARHRR